jgi:adenylosuccinate lyase
MGEIFSLANKYRIWTEIEVLVCEALAEHGQAGITKADAAYIRAHADFDVDHIDELEAELNHDVLAFLTDLGQHVDAEAESGLPAPSRWLHYGMTSSDLGDTALSYQLKQATELVIEGVRAVGVAACRRAFEHRETLAVGRTHGVHAEPIVFGMKFASWAWALKRAEQRLLAAATSISVGAISGAVGSYSSIDPAIERYVCEQMGLTPDPLSTQVIARDRHAQLASALAVAAATLEQIATEIRSLQRSEALEAEEPFSAGQKGSSAMPHKRNPITAERICGLARIVKANTQVALDNVALWHERDISHSSAERVALVDSLVALDYMLAKALWLVDGLVVYPERCRANLDSTRGLIFSSKALLALVDCGLTREAAYHVVQQNSMAVWADIQAAVAGPGLSERLADDPMCPLGPEELDAIFDAQAFLTQVGVLFERLGELEF